MLTISISRSVSTAAPAPSQRVLQTAAMFGLGVDETRRQIIVPPTDIPLPFPDRGIVFITGPSGGGKSTILSLLAQRCRERGHRVIEAHDLVPMDDVPLVDAFGESCSADRAMSLLSLVGLGDAFVMLRRPSELSDGQRARFTLARLMALADCDMSDCNEQSNNGRNAAFAGNVTDCDEQSSQSGDSAIILVDEFGAALDRVTAKIVARNLRRWISRGAAHAHTFIGATTHDDLIDALEPDVLILKGLGDQIEIATAAGGSTRRAQSQHDLTGDLIIERGSLDDYKHLAQFHYRSRHPGAVTDVFRMVRREAPENQRPVSYETRFCCKLSAWRSGIVGVLVRSLPALSCRLRDVATAGRYRGLSPREQAMMLNREVRTISRVVIDPQWRGLGLAVKLVRHALDHPEDGTLFTEALAAMGRVSPFFERAGMARFDPPPMRSRAGHARLLDAFDRLDISPELLASGALIQEKLRTVDAPTLQWLEAELRCWHRAAHRTPSKTLNAMSLDELLIAARDELMLQPVYFVFRHGSACDAAATTAGKPAR